MDYCEREYMSLMLELKDKEARMSIGESALNELKKRIDELYNSAEGLKQEDVDYITYDIENIMELLRGDLK